MMSPLIDVTNIVAKELNISQNDSSSSINHSCLLSNNKNNNSTSQPNLKIQNKVNNEKVNPVTLKCNSVKQKIINKNCKKRRKKTFPETSLQIDDASTIPVNQIKNDRVPPIEYDDNFFHSLESLSLNSDKEKSSLLVVNSEDSNKTVSKLCLNAFPNVQPPPERFSSTFQCIACGLELSSLEFLTNHLVKHIYEGLHAASWLNHAMSTLLREENTASGDSLLETNNSQSSNIADEQINTQIDIEIKNKESSSAVSSHQEV